MSEIKEMISDESISWPVIQNLRNAFSARLVDHVNIDTREEALGKGVQVIKHIFNGLEKLNMDIYDIEPGHGVGHIARDYANGLILTSQLEADPKNLFIGLVTGSVHEIGLTLVNRYQESNRVIRHAEAGALLLWEILSDLKILNESEKILICYGVAAHTHYLKSTTIKCEDGVEREVIPYQDTDEKGNPILSVWLARWIDRLDINGPAFVGRHYLTLADTHSDFDGKNFYEVSFRNHMKPLLRNADEIRKAGGNQTMLEHLNMFANSQNNESPYGLHDFGKMIEIRDEQTRRLKRIINSVVDDKESFSQFKTNRILASWVDFLCQGVEPTKKSGDTALRLQVEFHKLDSENKRAWLNGFVVTMDEYFDWSKSMIIQLNCFPNEWLLLGKRNIDVKKIISPP